MHVKRTGAQTNKYFQIRSTATRRRVSQYVKMSKPKSLAFAKYIFRDSTGTHKPEPYDRGTRQLCRTYLQRQVYHPYKYTCSVFKTLSSRNRTCIVPVAAYVPTPIMPPSYNTTNNKNTVTNKKKIKYFRFPPSTQSAPTYRLMSPPLAVDR